MERSNSIDIRGVGMTSQRTRSRLVQRLRDRGIENEQLLDVMGSTPRHVFVDEALASRHAAALLGYPAAARRLPASYQLAAAARGAGGPRPGQRGREPQQRNWLLRGDLEHGPPSLPVEQHGLSPAHK